MPRSPAASEAIPEHHHVSTAVYRFIGLTIQALRSSRQAAETWVLPIFVCAWRRDLEQLPSLVHHTYEASAPRERWVYLDKSVPVGKLDCPRGPCQLVNADQARFRTLSYLWYLYRYRLGLVRDCGSRPGSHAVHAPASRVDFSRLVNDFGIRHYAGRQSRAGIVVA